MESIQFNGLSELDPVDQEMVKTITKEYYDKIQQALKNMTSLVVHIKTHKKEGHRHKYEIMIRALAPTRIFESCKGDEASNWDLASALHGALKNIQSEIQHAFHD
ncbi:hypothetical protein HQ545_02860 [Candidatus Woesearchaeota archaeon]|nr:hypothetical protein [Candidatus Woesearchaeota archaeon]